MAEVVALPAASVIVLRDAPLEVLMLRRRDDSSFMPGVWVFPGGMVEPDDEALSDGTTLTTMRLAGARETFEESGLWLGAPLANAAEKRGTPFRDLLAEAPLDLETLVWTSRWITPVGIPKRFDTYFFLAEVRRDQIASVDPAELAEARWISPADALKELKLAFPTVRNLEAIAGFASVKELMDSRRGAVIEPIQPILVNGKPALP